MPSEREELIRQMRELSSKGLELSAQYQELYAEYMRLKKHVDEIDKEPGQGRPKLP